MDLWLKKLAWFICKLIGGKRGFILLFIIFVIFHLDAFSHTQNIIIEKRNGEYCYDGDTCTTFKGETIRLACIDTPELKGRNANPIPAKSAKTFLNALVANQEVSIKRITKDRYGRTVAELFKDEENIQELIVKKGFGVIYKKYSHQCDWSKNS